MARSTTDCGKLGLKSRDAPCATKISGSPPGSKCRRPNGRQTAQPAKRRGPDLKIDTGGQAQSVLRPAPRKPGKEWLAFEDCRRIAKGNRGRTLILRQAKHQATLAGRKARVVT
jgi:hypothetical protein